jgi:hypothetical protein
MRRVMGDARSCSKMWESSPPSTVATVRGMVRRWLGIGSVGYPDSRWDAAVAVSRIDVPALAGTLAELVITHSAQRP